MIASFGRREMRVYNGGKRRGEKHGCYIIKYDLILKYRGCMCEIRIVFARYNS